MGFEFTLLPGQLALIPEGWAHAVHNLDDTAALTLNFAEEARPRCPRTLTLTLTPILTLTLTLTLTRTLTRTRTRTRTRARTRTRTCTCTRTRTRASALSTLSPPSTCPSSSSPPHTHSS